MMSEAVSTRCWNVYLINSLKTVWKLSGDANAKLRKADIFKPTTGNETLRKINNDNGIRVATLPHVIMSQSNVNALHDPAMQPSKYGPDKNEGMRVCKI
jgi:hypothetical protein